MKQTLVALLLASAAAWGQGTVKEAMIRHWKTSMDFTIAVASAMPADSYNFRPNPEEFSFGQLMAHIAAVNANACSNAGGVPKPEFPARIQEWAKATQKVDVDRETALSFLQDTFNFCNKVVAEIAPDRLDKVVGPPARNLTAYEWLWAYFTHTAHHRGQAEVYLRVKGIKPPGYKF